MSSSKKGQLHPRNRHQGRYDFSELRKSFPELNPFIVKNPTGDETIDFANPEAVKLLNRALLKKYYGIQYWDIPAGFLCPPIPGRADYIHSIADLISKTKEVRGLDIGVGANCIYPILGVKEYGWQFVGTDVNPASLAQARKIVQENELNQIEIREQKNAKNIFEGVVKPGERFTFSMCNPPFHSSQKEADEVNLRKWRNLGKAAVANFGGQNSELWCNGGEVAFISQMVRESAKFSKQIEWFTSYVSKAESLNPIYDLLRECRASWRTIEMAQGQKKSRIVAWTFETTRLSTSGATQS